jgi:hypothetical protein
MDGMEITLRVCTKCPIRHFENCPQCAGFGVYDKAGELAPVRAKAAHDGTAPDHLPCPYCGSTAKGVPETVTA